MLGISPVKSPRQTESVGPKSTLPAVACLVSGVGESSGAWSRARHDGWALRTAKQTFWSPALCVRGCALCTAKQTYLEPLVVRA